MEPRIQAGDELRCPHCGRWHPLIQKHQEGTPYTRQMLFFECQRGVFYGGQIGTSARFPTRRRTTA